MPVSIGDVVADKYRIERELGSGSMGVVFEAHHLLLGQSVALKFMNTAFSGAQLTDANERFRREAKAAARLRGENIGRVLDVGTLADQTPYIVMEYLQGSDFRQLINERGRLPTAEAVGLILQACLAMAEAHENGILHRDLKPENLFLTRRPDGRALVKVLDFGVSKLFSADDAGTDGNRTENTQILGSPFYMAPEQIRSTRDVDERADIWSLGVILYELCAATLPYVHDGSILMLLTRVLHDLPRPLCAVAPDLPEAFGRVVDTCLEKDLDLRYQRIAELALALEPLAEPEDRPLVASICATQGVAHAGADAVTAPDSDDRVELEPEPEGEAFEVRDSALEESDVEAPESTALEHEPPEDESVPGLELAIDPSIRPGPATMADDDSTGSRFMWRRLAYATITVILGMLTASLALRLGSAVLTESIDQAIYKLGYIATRSARETVQLMAGPALQLALPLVAIFVTSWFFYRFTTLVCVWWLGQTLHHMAGYIADANQRQRAPLAGDIHEWGTLLERWQLLDVAGNIASAMSMGGMTIMVAALLGMVLRVRRPYEFFV